MKNGGRISRLIDRHVDTYEDVARRLAYRLVYEQVQREITERPAVTLDTFYSELEWQKTRIAELMKARGF